MKEKKESKAELRGQLQATSAALFEQTRVVVYAIGHLDTATELLVSSQKISSRRDAQAVVGIAIDLLRDGVRDMLRQRFPVEGDDAHTITIDEIPF